jgi:hypothetical protein
MVEQAKANSDELLGSSQLLSIDPRTLQRLELLKTFGLPQNWIKKTPKKTSKSFSPQKKGGQRT